MDEQTEKKIDKKVGTLAESVHGRIGRLEEHHKEDIDRLKEKLQGFDDLLYRAHPSGKESLTTRLGLIEKSIERIQKFGGAFGAIIVGIATIAGAALLVYAFTRGD